MVFILCYVWGKDTNDNVLGQKKKSLAKPGLAKPAHVSLENSLLLSMAFTWEMSVNTK